MAVVVGVVGMAVDSLVLFVKFCVFHLNHVRVYSCPRLFV